MMKKKLATMMMVALAVALLTGALAPLALAEGEEGETGRGATCRRSSQEYQGEVQEALATLQEPMERVRALAAELKEGRSAVVDPPCERRAREPSGNSARTCAPT